MIVRTIVRALTVSAASCTMNCVGRLAQRLERSVYTRKVVRSNRTVPTIRELHRFTHRGDVVQLVRTLPCRWLESYTVTARSPKIPDVSTIVFMHLHESIFLFRARSHHQMLNTGQGASRAIS